MDLRKDGNNVLMELTKRDAQAANIGNQSIIVTILSLSGSVLTTRSGLSLPVEPSSEIPDSRLANGRLAGPGLKLQVLVRLTRAGRPRLLAIGAIRVRTDSFVMGLSGEYS